MMNKKKNIALIVAAGTGSRSNLDIPKQYFKISNQTILEKTLSCFIKNDMIDAVQVVIHQDHSSHYEQAIGNISYKKKLLPVVTGGLTRQGSVFKGLKAIKDLLPDHVLIHDAARPFLSQSLIRSIILSLENYDGVAPALAITDSLRICKDNIFTDAVSRENLFSVQTPQAFHFQKIYDAHQYAMPHHTDDISIGMAAGLKITYVEGCKKNKKMTTSDDFSHLTPIKTHFPDIRVGHGYDVHRLIQGNNIILGGVSIPCPHTLKGHSDADVLMHALTDAILGSASEHDIGYHFPPSDNQWKNVNSSIFLKKSLSLLNDKGGKLNHIDCTIICERPKISNHREMIRHNIAKICCLSPDRVNIKATTTEKLGFTGRKEGIAANATVTSIF